MCRYWICTWQNFFIHFITWTYMRCYFVFIWVRGSCFNAYMNFSGKFVSSFWYLGDYQDRWTPWYLFVCLGYIFQLKNYSLILSVYRWRAATFDICSALMVIEHLRFFSVPHLLWHGASVYNGHLRGPVTLTPTAELLAVELTLPVLTT